MDSTCQVSLGASEQLSVALVPRHGRFIVAVDKRQVGQHPRHSVGRQIAVAVGKFVKCHVDPVVTCKEYLVSSSRRQVLANSIPA